MDEPAQTGSRFSLEEVTVTHARGFLCGLNRKICVKRHGQEAWERLLSTLSEPARNRFSNRFGDFEWIPIDLVNELESAFTTFNKGEKAYRQGELIADEQLNVVHHWLLKLFSPETVLSQGPTMFHFYYKGGLMEVEEARQGYGRVSLWALGLNPGWYIRGAIGWYSKALRMSGAIEQEILHEGPPVDGDPWRHRYTVRWKE